MGVFGEILYKLETRIVAGIFLTLKMNGNLPSKRSGFYCDSEHLKQRAVEPNTISDAVLLVVSICSTVLLVLGYETWLAFSAERWGLTLAGWYYRVRRPFDVLFLCFVYSETVTETLKLIFGMPRPHFFHTCRPNFEQVDCSRYVTEYVCTSDATHDMLIDAQQSFPSAHASFSATAAVAVLWYAVSRVMAGEKPADAPEEKVGEDDDCGRSASSACGCVSWLWPRLLCVLGVCWAVFCGWSRVADRRHHWWDVLTGAISGSIVAVVTISSDPWKSWTSDFEFCEFLEEDEDPSLGPREKRKEDEPGKPSCVNGKKGLAKIATAIPNGTTSSPKGTQLVLK